MPESTLKDIFPSSWGILKEYRKEVQSGAYGASDKYLKKAIGEKLFDAKAIAAKKNISASTVRKKLKQAEARYIILGRKHCYFINDVNEILTKKPEEG